MDISLLHAGLAAGAALAAVPVILHLFMRQTPKHVIFPALRLIRERQKRSKKRLKVKNWLLLAARMLLLALMALALARPTLNSETSLGDQEVPTALALVFDTSLSMEYTEQGQRPAGRGQAPGRRDPQEDDRDSEVFVIDSADPVKPVAVSPGSARKRIDALTLRAANRPLNAALVQANAAVAASNLAAPRGLRPDRPGQLGLGTRLDPDDRGRWRRSARTKKVVKTYILRLTPKEVQDVAVVAAEPASTVATEGEPVEIKATLRSSGPATEPRRRVLARRRQQEGPEGRRAPRQRRGRGHLPHPVQARARACTRARSSSSGGTDFMAFDDVRYFSFNVQPADEGPGRRRPDATSTPSSSRRPSRPSPSTRRPGHPVAVQGRARDPQAVPGPGPALAQGLRRRLPAQRRRPDADRLGQADGLRPRRGRAGRRPGRPGRRRRPTTARRRRRSCRRRSTRRRLAAAGHDLRPRPNMTTRSSTATPSSRPRADRLADLSLLGRQAGRRARGRSSGTPTAPRP